MDLYQLQITDINLIVLDILADMESYGLGFLDFKSYQLDTKSTNLNVLVMSDMHT